MRFSLNQQGSSQIVLFVAVGVILGIGIVGYRVMSNDDASTSTSKSTTTVIKKAEPASSIQTSADIKQATTELDATNVETDVNPDQLDADINSIQ